MLSWRELRSDSSNAPVWAVLGLAALLRFLALGRQHIWIDEAFTFHIATAGSWLEAALRNNTLPLFYALTTAATKAFGVEPWALRIVSATAGVGAVGALMWWARQLAGRRVAVWSGFVLALLPIHVYYSQEARAYSLFLLCLFLALGAQARAIQRGRTRDWLLFVGLSSLAFYSHYLAGLSLLASHLLWFGVTGKRKAVGASLLCVALAGLTLTPFLVSSRAAMQNEIRGRDWVTNIWKETPPALAVAKSIEVFALGAERGRIPIRLKQMTDVALPGAMRWIGLALLLGCALLSCRANGVGGLGMRLWVFLLTPLLVLWIVSWWKPVYVVGRYDLTAFAPFALLVGLGASRLSRSSAIAVMGPVILILGWKLALLGTAPILPSKQAQAANALATAGIEAEEQVLFLGPRGVLALYELARLGYRWDESRCLGGERSFRCRLLWKGWKPGLGTGGEPTPEQLRAEVDAICRPDGPDRIFLVFSTFRGVGSQLDPGLEHMPVLEELGRRGYVPSGVMPAAGVAVLRRQASSSGLPHTE